MVRQHEERLKAEDDYLALARLTIDTWVEEGRKFNWRQYLDEIRDQRVKSALESQQAGVFVSIYKAGELRGCMGTSQAVTENIAEEIVRNAIEACAYDPRFLPVEPQELYQLEISVDILGRPEYIENLSELDPYQYGIIVEKGVNRALLLPDLPGINTAEQQVEIAKEKAGIIDIQDDFERVIIERFEVERHQTDIVF